MKQVVKSLVFLVLFSFLSCGYQNFVPPDQDLAMQTVWVETYHMNISPPRIQWVTGNDLNCDDGMGFKTLYIDNGEKYGCVGGATYLDIWQSKIAWWPYATYFETSFAHELAHAYAYIKYGDGDSNHQNPDIWGPDGIVNQANNNLMLMGL